MVGDGSAFDALGLDPDADSAEIEQAYRRLIKQHHPDREGGDAHRAAEINRAYRELRGLRNLKDPLELHEDWPSTAAGGRAWLLAALLLAGITALVLFRAQSVAYSAPEQASRSAVFRDAGGAMARDTMDQPLHLSAIDEAAQQALRLFQSRDEMSLAKLSAECHRRLRGDPTMLQFDRCAAFDDAVVQLEDRDPMRDQGPFSEIAVTGRLWSGASGLSQDSLAIDSRLDRIRTRVRLAVAPPVQLPTLSAAPSPLPTRTTSPEPQPQP
ncbi:MAG TPA: J domain-containing protein [Sphingomicrobium sp.]